MSETTAIHAQQGVNVKLIGVLASAAGQRELHLSVETPTTVSELVALLLKAVNNPLFQSYLVDAGTKDPRPNVIILLNEQDCNVFNGLGTPVKSGTVVTIIPVAHGG